MSAVKLVVVVADIHCGSTVGLLPPGFVSNEGNELRQNAIQAWLWQCWLRVDGFIREVVGRDAAALVLNGDLIEGDHHGTKQIVSKDIGDHVRIAGEVLGPLAGRMAKVFVVKGTEVHTNNHENAVGSLLGAEKNPETGALSFDRLTVDVCGVRCVWAHHIGTSTRSYTEATQFSVAITEEQISAARNGEPLPRVIGRAHRHRFGQFENHHALAVVSPPWQAMTRFGHKIVTHERPHPGLYILDWRNKKDGELPLVRSVTYECPQPKAIKL